MSETDKAHRTSDTPSEPAARMLAACEELLTRLKSAPNDLALRERAARACAEIGRADESAQLLRDHFVHFNAHDWGALPCLCKRCLKTGETTAQVEDTTFVREFAIASGRLLYFWTPSDLKDERRQVIASVTSKLRQRLKKARK